MPTDLKPNCDSLVSVTRNRQSSTLTPVNKHGDTVIGRVDGDGEVDTDGERAAEFKAARQLMNRFAERVSKPSAPNLVQQ